MKIAQGMEIRARRMVSAGDDFGSRWNGKGDDIVQCFSIAWGKAVGLNIVKVQLGHRFKMICDFQVVDKAFVVKPYLHVAYLVVRLAGY